MKIKVPQFAGLVESARRTVALSMSARMFFRDVAKILQENLAKRKISPLKKLIFLEK
jgi:hypothetical protein